MKGIIGYASYLPAYRLPREMVAAAWQSRALGGQSCVARYDEDSLTMAAAAAQDCLAGLEGRGVSALLFATTTPPFVERLNASLLAAICDLPETCLTADLGGSLRAGTTALKLALDGGADCGLVCAADTRAAVPGSDEEQSFGDAAACVAVGAGKVLAELVACASIYDDFFDAVRRDRDTQVVSYASKFSTERGYVANLTAAIPMALRQAGIQAQQVDHVVINAGDPKGHEAAAKKLGFPPEKMQAIGWQDIGMTGCAMPLLLLCGALESARPGEWVLLAGQGNGADVFLFRTTEAIAGYRPRVALAAQRAAGISYPSYTLYRKAREYPRTQEDSLEISNVFYAREEAQNVRLRGVGCRHCGTRQLPHARICASCRKSDGMHEVRLARTGAVFTFAIDQLYPSPFPPTVMAVVDLDGGGRIYCEAADVAPEQVCIGMPVELTIRRLREGGGLHHYYWKCRPRRTK